MADQPEKNGGNHREDRYTQLEEAIQGKGVTAPIGSFSNSLGGAFPNTVRRRCPPHRRF